jgi:hypothetical protein
MEINKFTYHVTWSHEDNEHLGLCAEFPALSFLAKEQEEALKGIRAVVLDVCQDMQANGEQMPDAIADKI